MASILPASANRSRYEGALQRANRALHYAAEHAGSCFMEDEAMACLALQSKVLALMSASVNRQRVASVLDSELRAPWTEGYPPTVPGAAEA